MTEKNKYGKERFKGLKESLDLYKESQAIRELEDGSIHYWGKKMNYKSSQWSEFTETFGDDSMGECCGFIKVEVSADRHFSIYISTVKADIISLEELDIGILKKLSRYLNYAINQQGENNDWSNVWFTMDNW